MSFCCFWNNRPRQAPAVDVITQQPQAFMSVELADLPIARRVNAQPPSPIRSSAGRALHLSDDGVGETSADEDLFSHLGLDHHVPGTFTTIDPANPIDMGYRVKQVYVDLKTACGILGRVISQNRGLVCDFFSSLTGELASNIAVQNKHLLALYYQQAVLCASISKVFFENFDSDTFDSRVSPPLSLNFDARLERRRNFNAQYNQIMGILARDLSGADAGFRGWFDAAVERLLGLWNRSGVLSEKFFAADSFLPQLTEFGKQVWALHKLFRAFPTAPTPPTLFFPEQGSSVNLERFEWHYNEEFNDSEESFSFDPEEGHSVLFVVMPGFTIDNFIFKADVWLGERVFRF